MIVTILLGVVSLAVLVLAFVATKYWHWAHVTVLVLFYFASVGYAVLAARSLDTRLEHQERAHQAQVQLDEQAELMDGLRRGSSDPAIVRKLSNSDVLAADGGDSVTSTVQLEHELRMLNRMRGRVWKGAAPMSQVDPETMMVTVGFPVARPTTQAPGAGEIEEAPAEGPAPPLGLEAGSIIYVFEHGPLEGSDQGPPNQYLGEFRVEAVDGRQATLAPLDQLELDDYATERLVNSRGPWTVYETMPADSRDLFAGLDEETLRNLLPESVVEEYLRDGTPATPDDPPERLESVDADGNPVPPDSADELGVAQRYRRRLRDYAFLLADLEADRAELIAREQAITSDLAKLDAALKGAEQIRDYRTEEIEKWRHDLAAVERERRAIESHASTLLQQIENAKRLLDATLRENAQLAQVRANNHGVLVPMGSGALDVDAL